jgi:PAS domain S-box-containing protein
LFRGLGREPIVGSGLVSRVFATPTRRASKTLNGPEVAFFMPATELAGAEAFNARGAPAPEHWFGSAVDSAGTGMVLTDPTQPDNPIVYANPAFSRLTGYDLSEIAGRNCRFLQGPETDPATVGRLREAIAEARPIALEILNYRKDGTRFWNALIVSPVRDPAGNVLHFFATQTDVTQRRDLAGRQAEALEAALALRTGELEAALAERTRLLHELDHRVKNNIQLLIALIGVESRQTQDPAARAALARVRGRLQTLAAVHAKTYDPTGAASFDLSRFVNELAEEVAAQATPPRQVEVDVRPAEVPANKAAAVALLLHELLTELTADPPSHPAATLRIATESLADAVAVELTATGVRSDAAVAENAFVPMLLARQLRASIDRLTREGARTLRLRLPLDADDRRGS